MMNDAKRPKKIPESYEPPKISQIDEGIFNLHGAIRQIVPNLKIFGYGGSSKAFVSDNGEITDEIWNPYPYIDDNDFGKDYFHLI